MIVLNIPNANPYSMGEGLATKHQVPLIGAPDIDAGEGFCYCQIECEHIEKVFYSNDEIEWKNDKSSFLFTKKKDSDTIELELWKSGVKVADLVNDNYGIFYPTFANQPRYVGYLVDWNKVNAVDGHGIYQIKANLDILGVETVYESQKFQLSIYSVRAANKTIRIETRQTGNIIKSAFDFTDLITGGWYQSYRIEGKLHNKQPIFEEDIYVNGEYSNEQIQLKVNTEYELRTGYIPAAVANSIFYQNIMSNSILITDDNIINHEKYVRLDLIPSEPEEVKYLNTKTTVKHIWKMKERVVNNIKTNF